MGGGSSGVPADSVRSVPLKETMGHLHDLCGSSRVPSHTPHRDSRDCHKLLRRAADDQNDVERLEVMIDPREFGLEIHRAGGYLRGHRRRRNHADAAKPLLHFQQYQGSRSVKLLAASGSGWQAFLYSFWLPRSVHY